MAKVATQALLGQVFEAARELDDNLRYLKEDVPGWLRLVHGSGYSETHWTIFNLRLPEEPYTEIFLRRKDYHDMLVLEISSPTNGPVQKVQLTWDRGVFSGAVDVIEMDPVEPAVEILEAGLKALQVLNEIYGTPLPERIVTRAETLMRLIRQRQVHLDPPDGHAKIFRDDEKISLEYYGPGGESLRIFQEGRESPSIRVNYPLLEIYMTFSALDCCGMDARLLHWINDMIQSLISSLMFG